MSLGESREKTEGCAKFSSRMHYGRSINAPVHPLPTYVRRGEGGVTVSSYLLRRRSADAPLCIEMRVTRIE